MVDLSGRGEREVELRRQMEVEVEVLLRSLVLGIHIGEVCEWRGSWDHKEGHGLGTRWIEGGFLAILDMVGLDVVDGVEELGIVMASHAVRCV